MDEYEGLSHRIDAREITTARECGGLHCHAQHCSGQRAADNVQRTTCSGQRGADSVRRTTVQRVHVHGHKV
jgi:hypothetical protein